MESWTLKTPVVLLVFNRPELTKLVFQEVAKARPPVLLVVCDGPRFDVSGEEERVSQVRKIFDLIDWECRLLTNYSEKNLGCRERVSSGLDWVFTQVEEAIILEDDCLPDPSFFRFCQELLAMYRQDKTVGMISGDDFYLPGHQHSYYFSKYFHIWGWATWRDRWVSSYDVDMKSWPEMRGSEKLIELMGNAKSQKYWGKIFQRVYDRLIDTWDYQWLYANWINGRVSIMPSKNLITNIGFGSGATHTKFKSSLAALQRYPMQFPLSHPEGIDIDRISDDYTEKRQFNGSFFSKILNRIF